MCIPPENIQKNYKSGLTSHSCNNLLQYKLNSNRRMRAVSRLMCVDKAASYFPSADRSYGSLPTLGIRSPLMLFLNVHIATKPAFVLLPFARLMSWKPPTFCVRCSSMNLHLCLSAHRAPIGDHERFPLCMRLLQIPHRIMFRWGISFFFFNIR